MPAAAPPAAGQLRQRLLRLLLSENRLVLAGRSEGRRRHPDDWNDVVGQNGTLVTPNSGHYQFFAQNDDRIYISGKGNDYIKFTLNTEIFGIDGDDHGTFNANELPRDSSRLSASWTASCNSR